MKKNEYIAFLIISLSGLLFGQITADISIQNPVANGTNFTFEIHIQPTSDWGMDNRKALGDCSWYFDYNNAALGAPVSLTYVAPEVDPAAGYTNSTGLTGIKIQVTTDLDGATYDGVNLNQSVDYHLYTVQMTISDPNAFSALNWDQINTAIFNARDSGVDETFAGDGETSLPVELTSFTVEDGADGVLLKWTTESEIENFGFMLERRLAEVEDWNPIASYKTAAALGGQGNYSSTTDYEYIDNSVENGKEYEYRLSDVDWSGVVTYHATRFVTVNNFVLKVIPEKFKLFAAYPNPFNPRATIRYNTPVETIVRIAIYNHIGQKVRVLQNSPVQPGEHSVVWDSRDDHGQPMSAGVYFFKIEAGAFNKTHKMILLK